MSRSTEARINDALDRISPDDFSPQDLAHSLRLCVKDVIPVMNRREDLYLKKKRKRFGESSIWGFKQKAF